MKTIFDAHCRTVTSKGDLARCAAILSAAVLLVSSCSRDSAQPAKGRADAPVPVVTAKAEAKDVPVEIQAIGTVQAYSTVAMRPQITGPILEVHFEEGRDVKAGDLLFTIDPRPFEAALNQAQANLKRDEAKMANTLLNFQRTSNLFAGKIASQQDFDLAQADYLSAQATLLADGASISNAQVSLGYTSIRAPIDGRTGSLFVKKGNVVKAPDDALVNITQVRPIYVAFAVPEQHLSAVRRRMSEEALPVTAVVPGQNGDAALGELTFIDNTVDTNTGTILLKGTFANTNTLLWPGQFAQTTLTLNTLTQATVVPSQAVQTSQSGDFVFVVKSDSTVEKRPVETSVLRGGVIVIQKGLRPGETVVTDGQMKLVPGAKVNVKTQEANGSTNPAATAQP